MSFLNITKLDASLANFKQQLQQLLSLNESDDRDIHNRVVDIIADVRKNGDKAIIDYTNRFDHRNISQANELELPQQVLKMAWEHLPVDQSKALQVAADRIRSYAEHQKIHSWQYTEIDGTVLGQKSHSTGSCWSLCARWQSVLPFIRFNECYSGESGWCW